MLKRYYPDLEITEFKTDDDRKEYTEALIKESPIVNKSLKRILDIVLPKCGSIIKETNYVDQDFLDSYGDFYVYNFKESSKLCKRIHFFKKCVKVEDIFGCGGKNGENFEYKRENQEKLNGHKDKNGKHIENYLGSIIIRPGNQSTLSRSYISPSVLEENAFVLCGGIKKANLFGANLETFSSPYIQQDGKVSMCATVSIWMATEALSLQWGTPNQSTSTITKIATSSTITSGRAIPSSGLTNDQINWALDSMGYDPIFIVASEMKTNDINNIIYAYIESKIPVILGIEDPNSTTLHAVTIVGHGYRKITNTPTEKQSDEEPKIKYFPSNYWVPYFIVHDDGGGPYLYMEILNDNNILITNEIDLQKIKKKGSVFKINSMTIPLPKYIFLKGEEAETKTLAIIKELSDLKEFDIKDIVIRTFLMPSNQFKNTLHQLQRKGVPQKLIAAYCGKVMSKYIWISEISTFKLWNKDDPRDHMIKGEIIIDATSDQIGDDFISIHFPGHFIYMNRGDSGYSDIIGKGKLKNRYIKIDDDRDYPSIYRGP